MHAKGLLTVKDLSYYLGISPCTIYRWAENEDIPLIRRKGLGLRFRKEEVDEWLRHSTRRSSPVLEDILKIDLSLDAYDKLLLKGGSKVKSKGQRWIYPFGSVYLRPSRSGKERWYIYYRAANRTYVREAVKGATCRADALRVLRQRALELFSKANGIKKPKQRITFEEFAKIYLANSAHLKSWKTNKYRLDLHLKPFFGKLFLDEITPQHIEEYRCMRLKEAKPITTNRELALLKGIFTKAIDYGNLVVNPVKRVKMMPETDSARERILTPEEEKQLMAAAAPHLRPFLVIALNTGMRRGEILGLTWANVDFANRLIRVVKTKRNKNRTIPMNNALYLTLKGLKAAANGAERVYASKHVQHTFETARKNAKLNGLRLHDLRHTFATRLIQADVDVFTVQRILGHSTITMTMRYVHSGEAQMRDAVAQLEEKFAQSLHNFQPDSSPALEDSQATHVGSVN